jgi:cytochrome oxidase Cu insertion factor (SCO1/SenC/PrrC family)
MGINARTARAARKRRQRRQRIQVASGITAVAVAAVVLIVIALTGGFSSAGTPATNAAVDSTPASVGKMFPTFTLTAAAGGSITNHVLTGQKSLIWFTDTSSCSSCAPGATQVGQLDKELGGNAFRVLLVFVNVDGSPSALTSWQDTYGQPGWIAAVDNQDQLASQVQIPCLDTKFLLDEHGKILNVNSDPVDSSYLSMLQQKVGH